MSSPSAGPLTVSMMRSLHLRPLAEALYRVTAMSQDAQLTELSRFQQAQVVHVAQKCWETYGDELLRITR